MRHFRLLLHAVSQVVDGQAMSVLWPDHKPLAEVLDIKGTTPASVWEATYQGNATPPEGTVFLREWWTGKGRYDHAERSLGNWVVGRWLSWDTGLKDKDDSAYTALTVGELWPDYRLAVREVWRERLEFPDLPAEIERMARKYNRDGKLRAVIIEDKASGITALQTLRGTAETWLASILVPYTPHEDKTVRAKQAAVWCKNGCVLLPHPGQDCPWLLDFEDELFDFPGSAYADQVDSFSQLVIYLENLLAEGWRARNSIN